MASAVIGALKVVLKAESAQLVRGLRASRGDLHKTGRAATASGAALGALTAALGGIAVAAGRASMASMALNRGMANVATLIPGNTERVAALKTAVQDLAAAHGKSSQDLAAGLYQTISAFGDSAGRTMRVLEINSRAATAGVATVAEAVDLTSAVTKAYGDTSAEAVQKVADLALLTVRLGKGADRQRPQPVQGGAHRGDRLRSPRGGFAVGERAGPSGRPSPAGAAEIGGTRAPRRSAATMT